jgi:hypothetical protein
MGATEGNWGSAILGVKWWLLAACLVLCAGSAVGLALALDDPGEAASAKPAVALQVEVVPEMMTAVYKCYGGDTGGFLAITDITNDGAEPVTGFHIEYSIPGYSESAGQYDIPVILPGQTVRDYCVPTFKAQEMRSISTKTSAQLDVSYTYDGASGDRGTSEPFTMLSHNDIVWTYVPAEQCKTFFDTLANGFVLAALVTYNDADINRAAKRFAAGISTDDDDGTGDAVEAIWNGLHEEGFQYVSEPGNYWSASFSQSVQLPSETLERRAGNCVDLSLLFSAMLEAVGVKTYLYLSTGHCQVGFRMPESGEEYVIEETMVGNEGATVFDAVKSGAADRREQSAQGTWYVVDVEDCWGWGMEPSW